MLTPIVESRMAPTCVDSALVSTASTFGADANCGMRCEWLNQRFVPWDLEVANINFGANCGPASFAAVLGLEVCSALQHFPNFIDRPWCNFTQMKRALRSCSVQFDILPSALPKQGLALVQWLGPWVSRDFGGRRSLKYTHWI